MSHEHDGHPYYQVDIDELVDVNGLQKMSLEDPMDELTELFAGMTLSYSESAPQTETKNEEVSIDELINSFQKMTLKDPMGELTEMTLSYSEPAPQTETKKEEVTKSSTMDDMDAVNLIKLIIAFNKLDLSGGHSYMDVDDDDDGGDTTPVSSSAGHNLCITCAPMLAAQA